MLQTIHPHPHPHLIPLDRELDLAHMVLKHYAQETGQRVIAATYDLQRYKHRYLGSGL